MAGAHGYRDVRKMHYRKACNRQREIWSQIVAYAMTFVTSVMRMIWAEFMMHNRH